MLRHRPESLGLVLDAHGWVAVSDLLTALAEHGSTLTRADLERIVRESDKQRFELDQADDRIRARQGHSVDVDLALSPSAPPAVLFHGTPLRNRDSIIATGLERRGRHHVHLSPDTETAARVGARRGEHVVLVVDAAAMAAEGFEFLRTENGVWLTASVPPRFITVGGAAP